jgi:hypothetical protein
VKIVSRAIVAIAFGLVSGPVPGIHPEEPSLGVDRPEPAVLAGPQPRDVVPDGSDLDPLRFEGETSMARLVLPQAEGRRRPGSGLPVGQLELEDQHVLGQPALIARHGARDAQGEAFLSEEALPP